MLTSVSDWAGGPGDSKDDVAWLDKHLADLFAENQTEAVSALADKVKTSL